MRMNAEILFSDLLDDPRSSPGERSASYSGVAEILRALDERLDVVPAPQLASLVHWGGSARLPIHRWYRYREAFAPRLISELDLGNRLLDPFCGAGSILVGAAQQRKRATGIDVNPLATFAAQVKLTPLSSRQLHALRSFASQLRERALGSPPVAPPTLKIVHKVFEPEILDTLLRLRGTIDAWSHGDQAAHDFLLLAYLAILEPVGSYFKEGNGIKYRNRKRLPSGYVARPDGVWQRERFGSDQATFVLSRYEHQLRTMLADASEWGQGNWSDQRVLTGNCLDLLKEESSSDYDSIIFSPPYANRFDYFESMKVELWFGGFVKSYEEMSALRKASLRSHLGADLGRPSLRIDPLEQLISCMDQSASSWRMGVPAALRGYFDDMFHVLTECRRLLPTGRCHVVVGNSAFAGVIIPTDALIARLATEAGFNSVQLLVARHLTVAPQQRARLRSLSNYMRESVVVLG